MLTYFQRSTLLCQYVCGELVEPMHADAPQMLLYFVVAMRMHTSSML